jgi:hypothetical protein
MLEISLKRALKLRKELESTMTIVSLPLTVTVSLLVDVNLQLELERGRAEALAYVEQYGSLSVYLSKLRPELARLNVESGIEEILAEIADIDRSICMTRKVITSSTMPDEQILVAEMVLARKALENPNPTASRYTEPSRSVTVSITSKEVVEEATESLMQMKRMKETLEDKRTYTNASTKLKISDEDATLLRKAGLL